jgi:hypothetical protein
MSWYADEEFSIELDDIGDSWQLEAITIGNGQHSLALELPWAVSNEEAALWSPTTDEWEAWLKQSDNPTEKLLDENGLVKAIIRKAERQVDQAVVWKVYHRDNYTCRYCGTTGVPLTYDHYHPQALGGQTTVENGRASCRRCNKLKAHASIEQWKAIAAKKGLNAAETANP